MTSRKSLRSAVLAAVLLIGCSKKLPDVASLADRTARLRTADKAELDEISDTHAALIGSARRRFSENLMTLGEFEDYRKQWEERRRRFDELADSIDGVLSQAVQYSELLVELTESGRDGPRAASALLDSLDGFGALVGAPTLRTVPGVEAALKAIADALTTRSAAKSLASALRAAQPAVDKVLQALLTAYGDGAGAPLRSVAEGLAQEAILEARLYYGPNRLRFCALVRRFDEAYYGQALRIVLPKDEEISNWQGFCPAGRLEQNPACAQLLELQAVQVVRQLDHEARPACQAFRSEAESWQDWLETRRRSARSTRSALRAWARAHGALLRVLSDDRTGHLPELKAVLSELSAATEGIEL